jgi:hypothetical protein
MILDAYSRCIACNKKMEGEERSSLQLCCLTNCADKHLTGPGCVICDQCVLDSKHIGPMNKDTGKPTCKICPMTADAKEATYKEAGVKPWEFRHEITRRRTFPNDVCLPAQPLPGVATMNAIEVELEHAKTASQADKREADHRIAVAERKIAALDAKLNAAFDAAFEAAGITAPAVDREAAEAAAAARATEEAAREERNEAQRRETERRREEEGRATMEATEEELRAARERRAAEEQRAAEAQQAAAAALAAAAAAQEAAAAAKAEAAQAARERRAAEARERREAREAAAAAEAEAAEAARERRAAEARELREAREAAAAAEAEAAEAARERRAAEEQREAEARDEAARELREAQEAAAAAKAEAAAAAAGPAGSPPDTPAGRPSLKRRFLDKPGNTEEMWLKKRADAATKAKETRETRKRKLDAIEELEAEVARGLSECCHLRIKLNRVKQLARTMGASEAEINSLASDEEEDEVAEYVD